MSRLAVLFLLAIAPFAQAADDAHDLAYSLGVRLGERLRDEVPDLEVQALLDGLRQSYLNQTLEVNEARIESLLAEHEALLAAAPQKIEQAIAAEKRFLANEKAKPGVRVLKNGVLVQELRKGDGAKPDPKSRIQVRYIGYLADGSQFDETQTPQWYRLDSVIAGWRTALVEMPVGSYWRLVVPSAQAYGEEGAGDLIPPYAPLVFELELLDTRK
ncbi:FKBP-type peptidyl-prolyl cis-trans isomerase [Pseudomonas borbori]